MQVTMVTGNLHEFTLSKNGKSMGLPPGAEHGNGVQVESFILPEF